MIGENNNSATIVVTLPADAKLYFDNAPTTSKSERREFVSPALQTGTEYSYTLKAEIVRDGKTEIKTEKVIVRAGAQASVSFSFPTTVAAK